MKIAVVGASGYAGGELLRLLTGHPKFEISYIAAGSNAGELIANLHPQLTNFAGRKFEATTVEMINKCELAFIALPHGESAKLVSQVDKSVKIVDLGADFRLQNSDSCSFENTSSTFLVKIRTRPSSILFLLNYI